jgi:photosystem II stability/assembly factor-like uncharacterized protein
MKRLFSVIQIAFLTVIALFSWRGVLYAQNTSEVTEHTFGDFKARHLGPAIMSGRISALDAVQSDPRIIYIGSASGGLWKSKNGGVLFKPIFDKYNQSIGAITIDQEHPDTVWVGTGETWVRNSVSIGDGVYKTYDAGDTWMKTGLEKTERISRIVIHPNDPDTVYVAALGHLWNSNEERGVFKTGDGGKTWEKILYIDANTGCSDLAMDPENPLILYAGMWEFRRTPYSFRSGGLGSGLYITRDGGKSWNKVTEGIKGDTLGRVAISISPVNPKIVYALIESKTTALYRSGNRGLNWEEVCTLPLMAERPFYFSFILADPVDSNRIYKAGYGIYTSENGGKNFRQTSVEGGNFHGDTHTLWVSAMDNNLLYLGTDGGVYISTDKGSSWRFLRNLPVSQFYHVSADNKKPYHVYGGLQDNGSWEGPSKSPGGVNNMDWINVGGGDGFYVFADPSNDDYTYMQYQGGNILRKYNRTGETKEIKPYPEKEGEKLRFNWNTPVAFSPSGRSMYVGAQYLYISGDRGDSWQKISPDLTTDDTAKLKQEETGGLTIDNSSAENHCTIFTISESPLDSSIIWVGTDDGNLQVTRDRGKSWSNVVSNIADLPHHTWCSSVFASPYDKGTAFATFDGHRTGDMKPYVYETADFGKSWTNLSQERIPVYCHKILQDAVNANLLFLGTEFGLFVSVDGGKNWAQFKGNLPNVPVMDMVIHPVEHDLILATHGRGIVILDDITPIRRLTADVLQKDVAFLDSKPIRLGFMGGQQGFNGDDEFTGENPKDGFMITYHLKKRHVFGDMSLEIYDPSGKLVKTLPTGKNKGINRVTWDMRRKPPKVPVSPQISYQALYGPPYPVGEYLVKLKKGDSVYETRINVAYDPDLPHSAADRDLQHLTLTKAYDLLQELGYQDKIVTDAMNACMERSGKIENETLKKKLHLLSGEFDKIHKDLVETREGAEIFGEEKLRERVAGIFSAVQNYQGRPTRSQIDRLDKLALEIEGKKSIIDGLLSVSLKEVNDLLEKAGQGVITIMTREDFFREDK